MASNNQPKHHFSLHGVAQSVTAALIVAGVTGIWNGVGDLNRQMQAMNATIGGVRRDVDRHESLLNQQEFSLLELRARLTGQPHTKAIY